MSRSLTVSVPQPCHENWAAMTPATQGRHCAACTKTVVDFSRMTDAEVVAHLSQANSKTCGRFRPEQLRRPLQVAPQASAANRWVAAALAVLGVGAGLPALAQLPRPQALTQQTLTQQTLTMGIVAARPQPELPFRVVQGRVADADGQGLPGATVLVEGTRHGTSTRADGTYELNMPADVSNSRLVFSSIGFETVVEPISQAGNVVLSASCDRLTGEVVVTRSSRWYTPRGLWQRLTRPFRW